MQAATSAARARRIPRLVLNEGDVEAQEKLRGLYERLALAPPADEAQARERCRCAFIEAGRLGLLGTSASERMVRSILAEEERSYLSHFAPRLPLLSNAAAAAILARLGNDTQRQQWLPALASGERIVAVAVAEPAATTDPLSIAATATTCAEGFVLRGSKIGVTNATYADALLVLARLDGGAPAFFLVDRDSTGVAVRAMLAAGADSVDGSVDLVDVAVSASRRIGADATAEAPLQHIAARLQLAHCARAVARAELATGLAIHCAKASSIDGQPLFQSQAVRFKLADIYADLLVTRAFLDDVIAQWDAGSGDAFDPLMARLWVMEAEERILGEAAQLIGGLALSAEYPLAALLASARAENLASGTRETLRTRIFESVRRDVGGHLDVLSQGRTAGGLQSEHQQYRQSVRRFLQQQVEAHCRQWIASGSIPAEIQRNAAKAGILGVRIPAEDGGGGAEDPLYYLVMSEEMGRSSGGPVVGPLFQSDGLTDMLLEIGTRAQQQYWFGRILTGDVAVFAVTEPGGGSDVRALRTAARREGDDYVINGSKVFISFATRADFFMVLAKTNADDPTSLSFFLMDATTPGIEVRRLASKSHPCGDLCEMFFSDVRVAASALLGEREGLALKAVKNTFNIGHLQVAARAVGSIELGYRQALDYAANREVFGRKLLDWEHTQSVLAQMKTELMVARRSLDYCYVRFMQGKLDHATGSVAKLWHSNSEFRNIDRCFQLYGGAAFIPEQTISHHYLAARVQRVYDGTDEMQRQTICHTL